ncbi:MAG: glycosyltransferase [Solirubrobacterales bacterium]
MGTILLVSHAFPPPITQGSRRSAGLAKYLRRIGYRVIVLSSRATGTPSSDPGEDVIRTFDLLGTRANWRRRNISAHEGRAAGHYSARPSRLSSVLVPDAAAFTWIPFARLAAARLARRERIDSVITTAIPQSVHLIGAGLSRNRVPWIADLRDGWRFESPRERLWGIPDRLDSSLERRLLRRADHVVTVSEPISQDLRDRLGIVASTISNGYDSEAEIGPSLDGVLDKGRHSIVYTGRFAAGQRSPIPLVDAVKLILGRHPEDAARLEVVLAGPVTEEERELFRQPQLRGSLRHLGNLPRGEALWLQSRADSLLVVTAGARRGEITGKLFEYMHAGHPILVLGPETEAARIVTGSGAGSAVPADDPERIAVALLALVRGEAPGFDAQRLETAAREYSQDTIAERMAAVVESVRRAG